MAGKNTSSSSSSRRPRVTAAAVPAKNYDKALLAAQATIDKKGLLPVLLNLREENGYADQLVIVSAVGDRAVRAIADHVIEVMSEAGHRAIGAEGVRDGRWALIDFGDVVVHVFDHPVREFYDLENMWFDAPRVPLQVPADQMIAPTSGWSGGGMDAEDYGLRG